MQPSSIWRALPICITLYSIAYVLLITEHETSILHVAESIPELVNEDLKTISDEITEISDVLLQEISPFTEKITNKIFNSIKLKPKISKTVPETSVLFLKTHKTASSTIQNMLYRLGDIRDLDIAMSATSKHNIQYPYPYNHERFLFSYSAF